MDWRRGALTPRVSGIAADASRGEGTPPPSSAVVVRPRMQRVHHRDVAEGKGRLAVTEVIMPLADETVVEAERTHLVEAARKAVAPEPQRARVVRPEVIAGPQHKTT